MRLIHSLQNLVAISAVATAAGLVDEAGSATTTTSKLRGGGLARRTAVGSIPAIATTIQTSLPRGEPVACEYPEMQGFLDFNWSGASARRMYMASCAAGDSGPSSPRMFTSYTIGWRAYHDTSGAITETRYNKDTGKMDVRYTREFPECRSMHGVAASSGCGTVAALCRVPVDTFEFAIDAVAKLPQGDREWITNENKCGNKMNDHMWLYEWSDGDISKEPTKIIVHKSIGSWEYGENYLRFGQEDGTYGIALKAVSPKDSGGTCHEADSYMILKRGVWEFESERSRTWACAAGHTIHNRPAYDPSNKKYAMQCSTDWNELAGESKGAIARDEDYVVFRREDQGADERTTIQHIPNEKGGAGPLIAREGGGFLGVIVGTVPKSNERAEGGYFRPTEEEKNDSTPTSLGLVSYDTNGQKVGDIKWLVSVSDTYVGWPQLASLGNDRYLLGWGEGSEVGDSKDDFQKGKRYPKAYRTMEIEDDGNQFHLSNPEFVSAGGWGEVNEMVPLGDGRVGWSHVPYSRQCDSGAVPACNSLELAHFVYTSKATREQNSIIVSGTSASLGTCMPEEKQIKLLCEQRSRDIEVTSSTTYISVNSVEDNGKSFTIARDKFPFGMTLQEGPLTSGGGTIFRVYNTRTCDDMTVIALANGNTVSLYKYEGNEGDFQDGDKLYVMNYDALFNNNVCQRVTFEVDGATSTGWNISPEAVRVGRSGVVGPWWGAVTVTFSVDDPVGTVWTDSPLANPTISKRENGAWVTVGWETDAESDPSLLKLTEPISGQVQVAFKSTSGRDTNPFSTFSGGGVHIDFCA